MPTAVLLVLSAVLRSRGRLALRARDAALSTISPRLVQQAAVADAPVEGVLRSGCYVTHDDGRYLRHAVSIGRRLGCRIAW